MSEGTYIGPYSIESEAGSRKNIQIVNSFIDSSDQSNEKI